jgi:hypothetical protein
MLAIGIIIGKTGLIKYETMEEDLNEFLKKKNPELWKRTLRPSNVAWNWEDSKPKTLSYRKKPRY